MSMVEKVARAIDAVQLFWRWNDWTSDHVPGQPIEICRHDFDDGIVVVERHSGDQDAQACLTAAVSNARARAAIEAMRDYTEEMSHAGYMKAWTETMVPHGVFQADIERGYLGMIDAALAPEKGE